LGSAFALGLVDAVVSLTSSRRFGWQFVLPPPDRTITCNSRKATCGVKVFGDP